MALPTAIVMPRQAVYLAFMKSMRDPLSNSRIADIIDQARGKGPADLVIKSVGIFDLISGEVTVGDIAIAGDRIVGTYASYSGAARDRRARAVRRAGLHRHATSTVESSLVTPAEFDRCVLPHGVTTAICDPHEISNVLGAEGIRYFLECAERTVMDLRVQLSSCVPATASRDLGRAAGGRGPAALRDASQGDRAGRVHELPRRAQRRPGGARQARRLPGRPHRRPCAAAPRLDLNGYLAAGIRTDHETTTAAEAREKLAKGMPILIREGSVSKDLHALAELLDDRHLALPARSAPTTATRSTSPRKAISTT